MTEETQTPELIEILVENPDPPGEVIVEPDPQPPVDEVIIEEPPPPGEVYVEPDTDPEPEPDPDPEEPFVPPPIEPDQRFAYVDPDLMELFIANVVPDNISNWWEIPDGTDINDIYIDGQAEISVRPPKPEGWGDWAAFDPLAEVWIDPRTPEDLAAALQKAREGATLSKIDFIIRAAQFGFITEEDAKIAAKGEIPPSLAPIFASFPIEAQFEAEVRWAASTEVDRLNSIVLAMAQALNVTDAQLDAMFDITV